MHSTKADEGERAPPDQREVEDLGVAEGVDPLSRLRDERVFETTFRALGSRPRSGLFAQLIDRYSEPHRAYHTLEHIAEAFDALVACRDRVERWHEVELALWFHDASYDTHRHDNEERSADWARDELLAAGAAADVAARVHALVLATTHRDPPEGNDARLLVDADLSILAAPPDRFAAYERQIRQEYDWVPEPRFREAREKFLRGMLARPSIFNDAAMRERHEAHSRRNIEESLRRSTSSTL
jgi:predicted metal-dependent HD superfamily phosphohydrolase